MEKRRRTTEEVLRKYGAKIEGELNESNKGFNRRDYSREYLAFKKELMPQLSRYEKWCRSLGNVFKIRISEKDRENIQRYLQIAHLDVTPAQALALAVVAFLSVFFIGLLFSAAVYLITGKFLFLFLFMMIIFSVFLFIFIKNFPARLATQWRLKASSQMVPAILYVVIYMRHTSNLERAIAFASEHLQPPLSLDFKKIFYDVQVGKFSTIRESLDVYLETWRDYSIEFIESFHLIESSLFEPDSAKRVQTLEKALQVVLDGVYDRMLKFTHDVRSPLTNVYMLGVVLPTLGLALLPLASTLLQGAIQWYHVFVLFNLVIPFFVFYLTEKIMLGRPGGYGETNLLEMSPLYGEYIDRKHYFNAALIALPFLIIGLLPLIFYYTPLPGFFGLPQDFSFEKIGLSFLGSGGFFNFFEGGKGPFGLGALFLSLFIPLSIAMFFVFAFNAKTRELIKEREYTRQLEKEFNSSLFQLGTRLGNGTPAEIAFGKVAEASRGLATADFFRIVNYNIHQVGMSVERAIFDKRRGAIVYFPSQLIATSMRILIESSKKGLRIAARALLSISEYVKNIDKINERLKDLLAEVVSSMRSNMTFLAPLLAGVVVSLAGMITSILLKLKLTPELAENTGAFGGFGGVSEFLQVENMIPPYFLQIAIGIYLIEIIFILTSTLVTINSGEDRLERTYRTSKHLSRGMLIYLIVAFVGTLALTILSAIVLGGLG